MVLKKYKDEIRVREKIKGKVKKPKSVASLLKRKKNKRKVIHTEIEGDESSKFNTSISYENILLT